MEYTLLLMIPLAFACEYCDSSLGMGYGTTLTPLLLLFGYEPLQIVPAVLMSEFVTGITAAFFHHSLANVNFRRASKDTRVAMVLAACSVVGTVVAVRLAVKLPAATMKIWIGFVIVSMGAIILATLNRTPRFTWSKIAALGTVASFNKGMSGGGYGPLVMGGQILSGIGVKNAVGITSLAEGLTCLVGVLLFFVFRAEVDWTLAPWLMAGAVLSVPLGAHTVKRIPEKTIKLAIALLILILGALTLYKAFR